MSITLVIVGFIMGFVYGWKLTLVIIAISPLIAIAGGIMGKVSYVLISRVQNEQGTGYEYLISIESKNGSRHLKEHAKLSKFAKFESYWFKCNFKNC